MKYANFRIVLLTLALGGIMFLTGNARAATISASSCSRADVQTAINSALGGDTVVIPAGNCTWTSGVAINGKGIRLQGQNKGSVIITHSFGTGTLITVTTDVSRNVEISNLTFLAGSTSNGAEYISVDGSGKPALVHDNYFRNVSFAVSCIRWSAIGGVIWNNVFESLDVDGSSGGCFQLKDNANNTKSWTTTSTMGTADVTGTANVYIENNTFKKIILQAIDVDDNMRAVIRYNTFDNSGFVYHGADSSPSGARHVEVYNNSFIFTTSGTGYNFPLNLNWWVFVRGGTGVWTDNNMPDISSNKWGNKSEIVLTVQNIRRNIGPYPCWKTYPAPHQVGQSDNGSTTVTDPMYIWNNTGSGSQTPELSDYNPDECASGLTSSSFIQAGRDYVVGSSKPGYGKYTYPHPLTQGSGGSSLPPPSNLRTT